jgi:hypothetical protein
MVSVEFIDGMDRRHSGEFHDFFNKLQSLFKKLPNLEAFNLYPRVYDRRYEAFINVAVNTIGCLSLQNLTELEISHHYSGYYSFEELPPMENDSGTPRGGLANLRHLGLKGRFTWGKDSELELLQLIQTAVNTESLRLQYYRPGKLPGTLQFINWHRLQYLQLESGDITANEIFYLLKNSRESIRYFEITAHTASWLVATGVISD